MRRWVSLGGWCGPALMLSKLGLCAPGDRLPFDAVRSTFDGLIELTVSGFDKGYFPGPLDARPFQPDPVAIWLLFRSQHVCFTHFDLNNDTVITELQRRIRAWRALLSPVPRPTGDGTLLAPTPVTFLRTVIAEDVLDELNMLPRFHAVVRQLTRGRLDFRTVMVVHDQAGQTQPLCRIAREDTLHHSPCVVWNLTRQPRRPESVTPADMPRASPAAPPSLLDRCHDGYRQIITAMSKETWWRALQSTLPTLEEYCEQHAVGTASPPTRTVFRPSSTLSRVRGVPAVRGTCKGFGSTYSSVLGECVYCHATDHPVDRDAFDRKTPWSTQEEDVVLKEYVMNGGDEVAAVEAAALQLGRGANETWICLRRLLGKVA